jgi:predicted  nucleic acid-binding Zn-ribbon protein
MATCMSCGDDYPPGRAELGYRTCLQCGESAAKKYASTHFTVTIPYSKGAYQVVSVEDLKTTNPKR